MKRSKVIAALLCAVMLAAAALPALALSGSDVHDKYLYGIGVRARCSSSVNSSQGKAKLTLSFLPAPYTHFPESDYTVSSAVKINFQGGGQAYLKSPDTVGLTVTTTVGIDGSIIVSSADFEYYVNDMYNSIYTPHI